MQGGLKAVGDRFGLHETGLGEVALGGGHPHFVESLEQGFEFGNHLMLQ